MVAAGPHIYRRWSVLIALTVLLSGAFAVGIFLYHVEDIKAFSRSTFESRLQQTRQFVSVSSAMVAVMRNDFQDAYSDIQYLAPRTTRRLPPGDDWLVEGSTGTSTGSGGLPMDSQMLRELRAADQMSLELSTVLLHSPEVAWLTYISDHGFLHVLPQADPSQRRFTPDLLAQPFWRRSLPDANPTHRVRVAGPHEDSGGKGSVLTLAAPAYHGNLFLGVAAMELRVGTLTDMLNLGLAAGHTHLVSVDTPEEHGVRLASDRQTRVDWTRDQDDQLELAGSVMDDELWLVHHLPRRDLYLAAARDSMGTWLALLLTAGLCSAGFRVLGLLQQIARLTYHDVLTGLPNRRLLEDRLQMALIAAQRNSHRTALLFIDLDHFKPINDDHGHAVGDWLLQQVANRMTALLRTGDTVARLGGDEFVVLLPSINGPADALTVAEKLRQVLVAPFQHEACGALQISSSIGIALFPDHARTAGELLRYGDEAMYKAKKSGRDQVILSPSSGLALPIPHLVQKPS